MNKKYKKRFAKLKIEFVCVVGLLVFLFLPFSTVTGLIDLNSGKIKEHHNVAGVVFLSRSKQCRLADEYLYYFDPSPEQNWIEQYQYSTNILGIYPIPYRCECGAKPPHSGQPYFGDLLGLRGLLSDAKSQAIFNPVTSKEELQSGAILTEPAKKRLVLNALESARLPDYEEMIATRTGYSEPARKLLAKNALESERLPKCGKAHASTPGHFARHFIIFNLDLQGDRQDIGDLPIPESDIPSVDEVIEILIERNSD